MNRLCLVQPVVFLLWLVSMACIGAAMPAVEIMGPADGAEYPAGKPLDVGFIATGGPFIAFQLVLDGGEVVASGPGAEAPETKGMLSWRNPAPGRHKLAVRAYDTMKESGEALVKVVVTGGGGDPVDVKKNAEKAARQATVTKPSSQARGDPASGMRVRIISPEAGKRVVARPSAQGDFYPCTVVFEASGAEFWQYGASADGMRMTSRQDLELPRLVKGELTWWPWHGNGLYKVRVFADQSIRSGGRRVSDEVEVDVVGIPPNVVNPQNRIIAFFREKWGLDVPSVPITRCYDANDPNYQMWNSAAYLKDTMYSVVLRDNGEIFGEAHALNRKLGEGESTPIVKPAGNYDILVFFADFGDTAIGRDWALGIIPEVSRQVNGWHEKYAREHGLSKPIMSFRISGAYSKVPKSGTLTLSAGEIQKLTGVDPRRFNMVAQVDLTRGNRAGGGAGGMSFWGNNGRLAENVNMWTFVAVTNWMPEHLSGTLLDHEMSHCLGWIHEWPVGDGDYPAHVDRTTSMATLMFGWTDLDGDGIVEILDPTPYAYPLPAAQRRTTVRPATGISR